MFKFLIIQPTSQSIRKQAIPACRFVFLLCLLLAQFANANEENQPLKDLRYGVALYNFYQDNFLSSLTEIAVAEQRGGLQVHGEHAELLMGGISLSYGMDRKATAIFERLLRKNVDQSVKDQAWFYLGKQLYQRNANTDAKRYLLQIGDALPKNLNDEFRYLLIRLQMSDIDSIQTQLDKIEDPLWKGYSQFNLAVAQKKAGHIDDAIKSLHIATTLPAEDDEKKALLDRIYLSLAYLQLIDKRYEPASVNFQRVRLDGPWSEQAMLGYGWTALAQEKYSLAEQAWQSLSKKPLLSPVVQESFVAIAHLYEKMGQKRKALSAFEDAIVHYEKLTTQLDEMIAQVQQQDMNERWLDDDLGGSWLARSSGLNIDPKTPYLTHFVGSNSFQSSLKDFRDLQILQKNMQQWQKKILAYDFMLEVRQQARLQRIEKIETQQLTGAFENIVKSRNLLADQIDRAKREGDAFTFSDAEQHEMQQLLKSAKKTLASMLNAESWQEYRKRLDRVENRLYWQAAELMPAKMWQVKKQLNALDVQINKYTQRKQRLQQLMVASADLDVLQLRVSTQATLINKQLVLVNNAIDKANQDIRSQVIKALEQQKDNVRSYLIQTRLAMARIYDDYLQRGSSQGFKG